MPAYVICCWKMTSFMTLDGVTSFLRLKTLQIRVNECDVVLVLAGVLQCNGGKLEEAEDLKYRDHTCFFMHYHLPGPEDAV